MSNIYVQNAMKKLRHVIKKLEIESVLINYEV